MDNETVTSTAPELGGTARKGTALAEAYGAASYWHKRFAAASRELRRRQVKWFAAGFGAASALSLGARWVGFW